MPEGLAETLNTQAETTLTGYRIMTRHLTELTGNVRGHFPSGDAVADLGQATESLPEQWEQGFTTICVKPSMFINDPRDLPKFCREALRQATSLIG